MVGSQAILATFEEDQLPAAVTMSIEVDVLPIADDDREIARQPQFTGWCLDSEDLCVAELWTFREKDRVFVAALADPAWSTPPPSWPGWTR